MSQVEILSYLKPEVALCGQGQSIWGSSQLCSKDTSLRLLGLGLDLGMTAPKWGLKSSQETLSWTRQTVPTVPEADYSGLSLDDRLHKLVFWITLTQDYSMQLFQDQTQCQYWFKHALWMHTENWSTLGNYRSFGHSGSVLMITQLEVTNNNINLTWDSCIPGSLRRRSCARSYWRSLKRY